MNQIYSSIPRLILGRTSTVFRKQSVRSLETGPKGTYIAKHIPAFVQLEEGKKYSWCKCGLSKKQPFCDGAHKTTDMKPLRFRAEATKKVLLCQCKQTNNQPYCDFTHVSVMFQTAGKRVGKMFGK
ncbi:putative CDGSH iron-sulfur domain-containing protein 3, mitochondrial [Apostichopus japonicus]|uniref:Putative CDGSH iron-sulfur domain-containing protein 3, mitochondrial n=1 Tax=Stichopus japonicus TaxID=307972 RepID=A0A2G8LQ92_STIJA|nr:putative CDGSH iron-sulfur domain-containing protein 3, mitochondrial [Apostichopus japonicus]